MFHICVVIVKTVSDVSWVNSNIHSLTLSSAYI